MRKLSPGQPVGYWQVGVTTETRYDVPDQPMDGEMDPFFFLTRDKNFIPHEYPCRTRFAAERRGRRPEVTGQFAPARNWLPFDSSRLDLSGFWFRATHLATWARTVIEAEDAGPATLRLATCGGAVLFVNGAEQGFIADYKRNQASEAEFAIDLAKGENEVLVFFDDLAERDARYFIRLDYVSGPTARVGIPLSCDTSVASAIETALGTLHFERPAYTEGKVALRLPHTLPFEVAVEVEVEGDFMSHQSLSFSRTLAAGERRLIIGEVKDLPADFRHFKIELSASGFAASRVFGVEICHAARQGPAPDTLDGRIAEALGEVAEYGEADTVTALARLALGLGGERTEAMIAATLPVIEDCWDCADFALVPLLWARQVYGDLLSRDLTERIDAAILNYRYWMDEAGNDVQWYFSENHALLFHSSAYLAGAMLPDKTFRRSGRGGAEQSAVGAARLRAWLDHFEAWEMAEFNSAPYFPIDLKGLTTLFALAPDADIRDRAERAIVRLLEVIANSAHHGVLTAAQGRSYEHTLRAGRSLELSGIARLLWGTGHFGTRFHTLPQLALCLRDHGLTVDPGLRDRATWQDGSEQEWTFAQGENGFAALYHCKSRDFALGTAAGYRWFDWGYQETLLHARIGRNPNAQVWINHPGEVIHSGFGRPSYWGGSASVPRCQQYRGLAVLWFDGQEEQPDFTHAWFPAQVFDETLTGPNWAAARSGEGAVLISAAGPLTQVTTGPTSGCELRQHGRQGWWIVRVGTSGTLQSHVDRFGGLSLSGNPKALLRIEDPDYGTVLFHPDATVEAEGRRLEPSNWSVSGQRTVHQQTPDPA